MKFVIILFVAVCFVSAVKKEIVKLPEARAANMKKVAIECAAEHNVDPELVSGIADGSIARNEANNKFLYCFASKLALVSEDGHANVNKLMDFVKNHPNEEDFIKTLNKCNELTKDTPVATLVEIHTCYQENSPIQFSLE